MTRRACTHINIVIVVSYVRGRRQQLKLGLLSCTSNLNSTDTSDTSLVLSGVRSSHVTRQHDHYLTTHNNNIARLNIWGQCGATLCPGIGTPLSWTIWYWWPAGPGMWPGSCLWPPGPAGTMCSMLRLGEVTRPWWELTWDCPCIMWTPMANTKHLHTISHCQTMELQVRCNTVNNISPPMFNLL